MPELLTSEDGDELWGETPLASTDAVWGWGASAPEGGYAPAAASPNRFISPPPPPLIGSAHGFAVLSLAQIPSEADLEELVVKHSPKKGPHVAGATVAGLQTPDGGGLQTPNGGGPAGDSPAHRRNSPVSRKLWGSRGVSRAPSPAPAAPASPSRRKGASRAPSPAPAAPVSPSRRKGASRAPSPAPAAPASPTSPVSPKVALSPTRRSSGRFSLGGFGGGLVLSKGAGAESYIEGHTNTVFCDKLKPPSPLR